MAVFGHTRRLPEQAAAHAVLRLAVDARSGCKPDNLTTDDIGDVQDGDAAAHGSDN